MQGNRGPGGCQAPVRFIHPPPFRPQAARPSRFSILARPFASRSDDFRPPAAPSVAFRPEALPGRFSNGKARAGIFTAKTPLQRAKSPVFGILFLKYQDIGVVRPRFPLLRGRNAS